MNIFTVFILQNFSKIFSKTHHIAPFLKIFSGEDVPPNRSSIRVASRPANTPTLLKNILNPLPPPP